MSLQPPEEPARDETPTVPEEPARDETSSVPGTPSVPENSGPSRNRIILWVIVGGIALYLIGSGVYGIIVK